MCDVQQIGLCCDASLTSNNCLTPFTGSFTNYTDNSTYVPSCADFDAASDGTPLPLSPFCCDEMNFPGASCQPANTTLATYQDTVSTSE